MVAVHKRIKKKYYQELANLNFRKAKALVRVKFSTKTRVVAKI